MSDVNQMAIDSIDQLNAEIAKLKRQLAANGEKYNHLESASNAQKSTITELRQSLLHLSLRTHPDSDGCDACRLVRREIEVALVELGPK